MASRRIGNSSPLRSRASVRTTATARSDPASETRRPRTKGSARSSASRAAASSGPSRGASPYRPTPTVRPSPLRRIASRGVSTRATSGRARRRSLTAARRIGTPTSRGRTPSRPATTTSSDSNSRLSSRYRRYSGLSPKNCSPRLVLTVARDALQAPRTSRTSQAPRTTKRCSRTKRVKIFMRSSIDRRRRGVNGRGTLAAWWWGGDGASRAASLPSRSGGADPCRGRRGGGAAMEQAEPRACRAGPGAQIRAGGGVLVGRRWSKPNQLDKLAALIVLGEPI